MTLTSLAAPVALVQAKSLKIASVFLKEENYKMVCYTLYLSLANRQKSCYKVRIYTGEKRTFLEWAWHLTP